VAGFHERREPSDLAEFREFSPRSAQVSPRPSVAGFFWPSGAASVHGCLRASLRLLIATGGQLRDKVQGAHGVWCPGSWKYPMVPSLCRGRRPLCSVSPGFLCICRPGSGFVFGRLSQFEWRPTVDAGCRGGMHWGCRSHVRERQVVGSPAFAYWGRPAGIRLSFAIGCRNSDPGLQRGRAGRSLAGAWALLLYMAAGIRLRKRQRADRLQSLRQLQHRQKRGMRGYGVDFEMVIERSACHQVFVKPLTFKVDVETGHFPRGFPAYPRPPV
jgi:hypothetical protein